MAAIPVWKQGKVVGEAQVDEADYAALVGYRWLLEKNGYARRIATVGGKRTSVYMHRELLGHPDGLVDHANGVRLDNRRANLRVVTPAQNSQNVALSQRNKTGFRGVWFNRRLGKYGAQVGRVYLGLFDTAEEAGEAAEAKRRELGYLDRAG